MSLKTRQAKVSRRSIYLQDTVLRETAFQPGQAFQYLLDPQAKTLVILPDYLHQHHTVSQWHRRGIRQPVLDLRAHDALEALADTDYWHVTIDHDRITVAGIQSSSIASAPEHETADIPAEMPPVLDLVALCNARPTMVLRASRRLLAQAAGGVGQLHFFDPEDTMPPSLAYATRLPLLMDGLFSGAGLLERGFADAGFTIAYAVEQNPAAAETYRAHLGNHIEVADIRTIPDQRFRSPVMVGASPCVGFSSSNRCTQYLANPQNALVRAYIHAVHHNPACQVFVFENVPHRRP